jgi:Domain of unknown function (DUF4188)
MPVQRTTVDLSSFPDLVVIDLGMRVRTMRGVRTLIAFGPEISSSVAAKPEGLLRHEPIFYSLFPLHVGMRQYWNTFEALETWARSLPHSKWWGAFLRDAGGVGFWHETYFMRGGMEAVYDNLDDALGLTSFAPHRPAKGAMFSARRRAGVPGTPTQTAPVEENQV